MITAVAKKGALAWSAPVWRLSSDRVMRPVFERALVTTLMALALGSSAAWVRGAAGQELEPRTYVNTPVGLNFLIASYGTDGNVVFSAAPPIEDAEVQVRWGGGL